MSSCAATPRDPLLPGHRWQSLPVEPPDEPWHACPSLPDAGHHDSTAARGCRGHPRQQAQSISAERGFRHAVRPEMSPRRAVRVWPGPLPPPLLASWSGQSRWLLPWWDGPTAGTELQAPDQASSCSRTSKKMRTRTSEGCPRVKLGASSCPQMDRSWHTSADVRRCF